jgi:hypothetical protein
VDREAEQKVAVVGAVGATPDMLVSPPGRLLQRHGNRRRPAAPHQELMIEPASPDEARAVLGVANKN